MSSAPISDADLHAFVDGELSEARHGEIAAWLAEHPEDALRVSAYRDQKAGLHRLFDPQPLGSQHFGIVIGIGDGFFQPAHCRDLVLQVQQDFLRRLFAHPRHPAEYIGLLVKDGAPDGIRRWPAAPRSLIKM